MPQCEVCPLVAYYGLDTPRFCRKHKEVGMRNVVVPLCEDPGCTSTSRAFGLPGGKGVRCKTHALPGMINVVGKRCDHDGCTSLSRVFDNPGGKGRFCKDHATSMMINVVSRRCCFEGCSLKSRNFDLPGGPGRFCFAHKQDGMVDVLMPVCSHPGCTKRPNYGPKGEASRYCAQHKLPGMCSRSACELDGCTTIAGYNSPGESSARFCSAHKQEGMVNVRAVKCTYSGCTRCASFGHTAKTRCKAHAEVGMKNLACKLCDYDGCTLQPGYGRQGEPPTYCRAHAESGMVFLRGTMCSYSGCTSRSAIYGLPGASKKVCRAHREPGMVNVQAPRCETAECTKIAVYGIPGGKPSRCAEHRSPGMLTRPRARCRGCRKPALYGKDFIPARCEAHKEEDDDNLMERECVSCHLTMVLDKNDTCEYCDKTRFETNRLAKQKALMDYLDRKGLRGNSTDIMIDHGTCGRERPDRVFDFDDKIVILECDEHQHRDRQCSCEQARMVNISQAYGGMPVYFIRWNPDSYTAADGRAPEVVAKRHKLVADFLRDIHMNIVQLPDGLLSVIYLYYDGWDGLADAEWTVVTPFTSE